jgi:hypothetical protein
VPIVGFSLLFLVNGSELIGLMGTDQIATSRRKLWATVNTTELPNWSRTSSTVRNRWQNIETVFKEPTVVTLACDFITLVQKVQVFVLLALSL